MSKALVACFSASGVTAKLAKALASATDADLFEIKPVTPCTSKDLNWMDKTSRSTIEMQDKSSRPEMAETLSSCAQYDTVFVGFRGIRDHQRRPRTERYRWRRSR